MRKTKLRFWAIWRPQNLVSFAQGPQQATRQKNSSQTRPNTDCLAVSYSISCEFRPSTLRPPLPLQPNVGHSEHESPDGDRDVLGSASCDRELGAAARRRVSDAASYICASQETKPGAWRHAAQGASGTWRGQPNTHNFVGYLNSDAVHSPLSCSFLACLTLLTMSTHREYELTVRQQPKQVRTSSPFWLSPLCSPSPRPACAA